MNKFSGTMKTVLIILASVIVHSFCFGKASEDSLRTKWMNGKGIILHKVEAKETWTGISRKYNVPVKELMVENEGVTDLKTGQIILVPVISLPQEAKKIAEEMTSPSHAPSTVITSSSPVYHSVQSKETLFSISKKYNVTIDDIKEWNNLTTSQVNKGQKIIVGYKEKKDTGKPSSNTEPTGANSKNHDNVFASSYKESPALMKNNEVITADAGNTVPAPSAPRKPLKEIKQTGVAAWIADNELDKNKYYALHRTAAIGTIIKVTNRMNNKYVFVKVVGVLPETGDNDNLVIKLSQAAAGKLGVIDSRFQAGLSYGVMEE